MNAINISSELVPIKNGLYFDPKTALYYDTVKEISQTIKNFKILKFTAKLLKGKTTLL